MNTLTMTTSVDLQQGYLIVTPDQLTLAENKETCISVLLSALDSGHPVQIRTGYPDELQREAFRIAAIDAIRNAPLQDGTLKLPEMPSGFGSFNRPRQSSLLLTNTSVI